MTTKVWPASFFAMVGSRVSVSYGYNRTPTQRNTPKPSHPIKRLNTTHISAVNLKVVALVLRGIEERDPDALIGSLAHFSLIAPFSTK